MACKDVIIIFPLFNCIMIYNIPGLLRPPHMVKYTYDLHMYTYTYVSTFSDVIVHWMNGILF